MIMMNRNEFILQMEKKSPEDLKKLVTEIRKQAESRIPEEVTYQFRALDSETLVKESYEETEYGKTHVFFVRPAGSEEEELSVILNVHGGGWSLPHGERDIYFSRRMADRLHCLVIDVDYVLAPEYPYPEALLELEALLRKLPEILKRENGKRENVVVCGQSAGGNLLAGVLERRKFKEAVDIVQAILCYLPTDNFTSRYEEEEELTPRDESTEAYGFFYNEKMEDRKKFDVSLNFSSIEELRRMPKTDIITAGIDNLMPEGKRYYELLTEAGVETSYRNFANSRHGFLVNLYDEYQECEDYVVDLVQTRGRK